MVLKVGCCGFPGNRRAYAAHFPVVEVQQTFYQPPRLETARRWREEMPPDFEFTLKAWQLITHPARSPTYRRLKHPLTPAEQAQAGFFQDTPLVWQAWEVTREVAQALQARVILFQCPASFTPVAAHLDNLRRFFQTLPPEGFLYAWEPRGTWPRELVAALCEELSLIPALDPLTTVPFPGSPAYFRLHGIGGYRYTYTEADLQRLATLVRNHEEAYVLFNNFTMGQDAQRFLELLAQAR